jgi:hypothetical protein
MFLSVIFFLSFFGLATTVRTERSKRGSVVISPLILSHHGRHGPSPPFLHSRGYSLLSPDINQHCNSSIRSPKSTGYEPGFAPLNNLEILYYESSFNYQRIVLRIGTWDHGKDAAIPLNLTMTSTYWWNISTASSRAKRPKPHWAEPSPRHWRSNDLKADDSAYTTS